MIAANSMAVNRTIWYTILKLLLKIIIWDYTYKVISCGHITLWCLIIFNELCNSACLILKEDYKTWMKEVCDPPWRRHQVRWEEIITDKGCLMLMRPFPSLQGPTVRSPPALFIHVSWGPASGGRALGRHWFPQANTLVLKINATWRYLCPH